MNKKILAAALIWLCFANNIKGQTILNPGFEISSAPPCSYNLSNAVFNSYVSNVTAFGTYENCDIMHSSCGFGIAQQGDWFVGLSVPPGAISFDAIAVELSSPLLSGQTYELSFYQKKDAGYASNPLDIGYSANNTSMGTPAASVPAVASSSWILESVVFTPSSNASYITIRVAPTAYGWNHLDNLQLTNITSVEEEKSNSLELVIFPNPANEWIEIKSAFRAGNEIQVTDALGKILFTKKILFPTSDFRLLTSDFSNGIYFLSVQIEKDFMTRKIVVNH